MNNKNYYNSVIKILYAYLGPAAERFLQRQIKINIFEAKPNSLSATQLKELIQPLSISLITLLDLADMEISTKLELELKSLLVDK